MLDTHNDHSPENPINQPDPTPLKSASLFEAVEAIKEDNPHIDWSEVDYYFDEMHADSERNRKAFSKLKENIKGMNNEFGWKVILSRIIKHIKL